MTSVYFQTFASASKWSISPLYTMILLLKDFYVFKLCFLGHCDLCFVSRKLLLKKLDTSHSDTLLFLATALSVRHFKVGSGLEETWCLFKAHFAVVFIYSQGTVMPLFPIHICEDFLKNLSISSICHFDLLLLLLQPHPCGAWDRVGKLLRKKEPFPAVAPILGLAFRISVQGGNCDLWQLGGDLKLPCARHSHFQPSLTSCVTSAEKG